jgi:hypothetical protein
MSWTMWNSTDNGKINVLNNVKCNWKWKNRFVVKNMKFYWKWKNFSWTIWNSTESGKIGLTWTIWNSTESGKIGLSWTIFNSTEKEKFVCLDENEVLPNMEKLVLNNMKFCYWHWFKLVQSYNKTLLLDDINSSNMIN